MASQGYMVKPCQEKRKGGRGMEGRGGNKEGKRKRALSAGRQGTDIPV
jgi:hypothetical protein